jgi:hypothetical protein
MVIAGASAAIDRVNLSGTFRFVHVDGSHVYQVVKDDIATTRCLLAKGGVAVFDDWSKAATPGVALAIWEEYVKGEMIPLAVTDTKLYATWDSSGVTGDEVAAWASAQPDIRVSRGHELAGRTVQHYAPRSGSPELRKVLRRWVPPALVDGKRRWMSQAAAWRLARTRAR